MRNTMKAAAVVMAAAAIPMLAAGGAGAEVTAGELRGSVWFDRDGDGVKEDGERGSAGSGVQIKNVATGSFAFRSTDAAGNWALPGAAEGEYEITLLDDAFANTTAAVVRRALAEGGSGVVDFGVRGGAVCGAAWLDADEDGVRDAGEAPIGNSTIGAEGPNSPYTSTDATGNYCLEDLRADTYVLVAADRAFLGGGQGWTRDGRDSEFAFTDGRTAPMAVGKGARLVGVDAGYVAARVDMRTSQLLIEHEGRTYASDQGWVPSAFQVGDEFTVYGGVLAAGNVAEQLGAVLTVPEGLTVLGVEGGIPATAHGRVVRGITTERRYPGMIEFIGARVRVDAHFTKGQIRLEALRGLYADTNPGNNVLTAAIDAKKAPVATSTRATTPRPATTQPTAVRAVAPKGAVKANTANTANTATTATAANKAAKAESLAQTGADPAIPVGIGAGLLALGGAALWVARRRRRGAQG